MTTSTNPRIVYIDHSWGEVALSPNLYEEASLDNRPTDNARRAVDPVHHRPTDGGIVARTGQSAGYERVRRGVLAVQSSVLWLLVTLAIIAVMCSIGPTIDREQTERGQWHGARLAARGEAQT